MITLAPLKQQMSYVHHQEHQADGLSLFLVEGETGAIMNKPTHTSEEHVLFISVGQVSNDDDWTRLFELKMSNNLV